MVAAMDFKKCRNASEHWRWLHFRSRRVLTSANKPDHGNSIKLGASLILAESPFKQAIIIICAPPITIRAQSARFVLGVVPAGVA